MVHFAKMEMNSLTLSTIKHVQIVTGRLGSHIHQARSQPSLRGGVSRGCVRDPSDRDAA